MAGGGGLRGQFLFADLDVCCWQIFMDYLNSRGCLDNGPVTGN